MCKSIANLYRYAEISKAANKRFLDSMQDIIPAKTIEKEINGICSRKEVKGRVYSGYNVWSAARSFSLKPLRTGNILSVDLRTGKSAIHSATPPPRFCQGKGTDQQGISKINIQPVNIF